MKQTVSLKQNREFRRIYSKGKSAVSSCLAIYCRKSRRPENRLGITVGGKLGNAVVRNRIRRRLREIYRTNEDRMQLGYDVVIVVRARAVNAPYAVLERSFLQLGDKLCFLRREEAET